MEKHECLMQGPALRSLLIRTSAWAAAIVLFPSAVLAQVCPTAWERQVVALYNQERAAYSLPPLAIDVRLVQSARGHSEDMASNNFFDHEGSDGSRFDERILAAGYPSPRSENIAAGYSSPASVVAAWMGSAGHRANILDSTARHVGVGYAYNGSSTYGRYWTANMGRSSGSLQLPPAVCADVWTNTSTFSTGQSLSASLKAENFGSPSRADFYFGVVLPDGNRVFLFTSFSKQIEVVSASNVSNWTPMAAGVNLAAPFNAQLLNFFSYTFSGGEPAGTYTFFLTVAVPGSFSDGTVDEGDIIHSDTASITFAP